jgi:hypothetical protein
LVPFHVGLGYRLAVADGLKRTAVVVDGNYTIYGTSTGLVEVYEETGWSASTAVLSVSSAGLNSSYFTSAAGNNKAPKWAAY